MCRFEAPVDFDTSIRAEFDRCDDSVLVVDPNGLYVTGEQLSGVKILASPSTGLNHIDLDACKQRGIKVLSLLDDRAGLETISASAEYTFKLLLDSFRRPPAQELQGKVIGLIGFGRIGRRLRRWLDAFGAMGVLNDPQYAHATAAAGYIFRQCDGVVICCSLTDETRGMITKGLICSMKPNAVLVNTARGEIIDEGGLYQALWKRPDIRFATDVVHGEVEGRAEESRKKLRELGAVVTNHIAGATFESRTKAARIILNLLRKELCESVLWGSVS